MIVVQAGTAVVAFASEQDAAFDVVVLAWMQAAASDAADQVWASAALFAAPEAADAEPGLHYVVALQALYFAAAEFRFVDSVPVSVSFPGLTALRVADSWVPALLFSAERFRCLARALPVD